MSVRKNLKWILLGTGATLVFAVMVGAVFWFVMSLLKGEAYERSLSAVMDDRHVVAIVGTPMTPSRFVWGNISTSGPDGNANLEYTVSGPQSSAKVYVNATRTLGEWRLNAVVVVPEGTNQRIIVAGPDRNGP
ncbi:cytochrome c oxidase assembly factor Coa1 family protein [Aliidiomarina indica]|uniref:cytochrome c oxidase assembly factor Coa1 family protein n=1 Tax=Aliidiomarina indica TaxID=2749147 RepID=UPI001890A26C|nr:cytochrome c oxidase assembly factor Coa1 family protein [Aliidiomarina indica]